MGARFQSDFISQIRINIDKIIIEPIYHSSSISNHFPIYIYFFDLGTFTNIGILYYIIYIIYNIYIYIYIIYYILYIIYILYYIILYYIILQPDIFYIILSLVQTFGKVNLFHIFNNFDQFILIKVTIRNRNIRFSPYSFFI